MEIDVEGLSGCKNSYDNRWLDKCKCGCGFKFVSKMMFKKFLNKFKDIDAEAEICSHEHFEVAKPYKEITVKIKQYYPVTKHRRRNDNKKL